MLDAYLQWLPDVWGSGHGGPGPHRSPDDVLGTVFQPRCRRAYGFGWRYSFLASNARVSDPRGPSIRSIVRLKFRRASKQIAGPTARASSKLYVQRMSIGWRSTHRSRSPSWRSQGSHPALGRVPISPASRRMDGATTSMASCESSRPRWPKDISRNVGHLGSQRYLSVTQMSLASST